MSGKHTAELVLRTLSGQLSEASARKQHIAFIERSCKPFWRLIKNSYNHSFREMFIHGSGPLQMPGAIISILAGQVFPKVPWPLRWRHRLFDLCVWLQRYIALTPHREPFSLVSQAPQPPMFLCPPPQDADPSRAALLAPQVPQRGPTPLTAEAL
jgi:hypothetical protein